MSELTDRLDAIQARAEYLPKLLMAPSEGASSASVYEEADGLETICTIPGYYSTEAQDALAQSIVDMRDDREFLLDLARKQQAALDAVRKLHPRTCEINGDSTDCNESKCPMLVCGPCGEGWPCPTIRALGGDDA